MNNREGERRFSHRESRVMNDRPCRGWRVGMRLLMKVDGEGVVYECFNC